MRALVVCALLQLLLAQPAPAGGARVVQLWTCGADPAVPPFGSGAIETSVFEHIQNITAVSVCGLSLTTSGHLVSTHPPIRPVICGDDF